MSTDRSGPADRRRREDGTLEGGLRALLNDLAPLNSGWSGLEPEEVDAVFARVPAVAMKHTGNGPVHAALVRLARALVEGGARAPDGTTPLGDVFDALGDVDGLRRTLPKSPPPAPTAAASAARITIDPAAVARNFIELCRRSRGECGAVVKADAYGLGIGRVVPALAAEGCSTFLVALAGEGLAVVDALGSAAATSTVYVLNGLFDPAPARSHRLVPFLSSPDALAAWPEDLPFALNVDTGMNRLGFTPGEALAVTRRPVLVASHFACADTPDHPLNARQEAAFAAVRCGFRDVPASLANSAALLTRPAAHYDLVRPGIALYGGVAAEGVPPLEPVVSLEARIVQVREAAAGETVGYGAAETLRRPSRIAIASLGYADGYLRAAGGSDRAPGAPAAVNGVCTRLLGRVSMDLIAVDVTDAPAARGDWVELFGPTVPLAEAAAHAGTIDYELLTGLSRRAERRVGAL